MTQKKRPPEPVDDTRLSRDDFAGLLRTEHALSITSTQVELLAYKQALADAQYQAMKEQAQKMSAQAIDAHKAASKAQKEFVASLEARYHFSFKTHSYCPDTGVVRRVLED
jgi:hypothetical protein